MPGCHTLLTCRALGRMLLGRAQGRGLDPPQHGKPEAPHTNLQNALTLVHEVVCIVTP